MYEKFFQFSEPPFNLTPDPRFFFFSKKHEEAFEHILFGVKQRKGFIVITGEVGTGKTTLCRLLLDRLDQIDKKVKTAMIFNPSLTTVELLGAINQDFGLKHPSSSKGELVAELNRFLLRELGQGGNALLIIDEAQNLSTECMEEIRMLSNLETEKEKLLQILMVGQPELRKKLGLQELRQLNQRITLRYHIEPLDLSETRAYIGYRLKVAGGQDRVLFTPKAIERVYQVSTGVPRLINAICDKALLAAFVTEAKIVNEDCVSQAVPELAVKELGPEARNHRKPAFSKAGVLTIGSLLVLGLGLGWVQMRLGHYPMIPPVRRSASDPAFLADPGSANVSGSSPSAPQADPAQVVPLGFDTEGVYRVHDPAATESAALLTLMKLWGIDPPEAENIPVEDLTKMDGYQLLQAYGLRTYTLSPDFKRLRIFDYPCLLSGHWGEGTDTSFLVLTGLTDTEATVLDPLRGRKNLSLEMLQSLWGDQAVLVWKALPGVVIPARGRESASGGKGTVRTLQEALKTEGFYKGKVDGRMGPKTRQAVRLFQERWGLEIDGIFGIESHLVLSKSALGGLPPMGVPSLKAATL